MTPLITWYQRFLAWNTARLVAGAEADRALHFGAISPALTCPHCGTKGQVRVTRTTRKRGISGGKAAAAVVTAGFSLLATGLSRKEDVNHLTCGACKLGWDV